MEKATCQVCGRAIKASTGVIAHHGYQRPYDGWQTASCAGARYVPYEESCDRLREVAEMVRGFIISQEEMLENFLATPPETIIALESRGAWSKGEKVSYIKPEGFIRCTGSSIPRTYESAYSGKKYAFEQAIKSSKDDLSIMERRLAAWAPVVTRQGS